MIFFMVWLRGYSREVLRESFELPILLIAIGILGILEDLGNPTRRGWAFWLDLFQHAIQHKEPKPKTPTAKTLPQGWASGLDLCQHAKPTQRAKPQSPAIQPTKYQYNSNISPV